MLTTQNILHIIISECKNSCHDEQRTVEYFKKHYPYESQRTVQAIARIVNYAAIRENESALFTMTVP